MKTQSKRKRIKKIPLTYAWDIEFKKSRSFNVQTKFNMDMADKINELIDVINSKLK